MASRVRFNVADLNVAGVLSPLQPSQLYLCKHANVSDRLTRYYARPMAHSPSKTEKLSRTNNGSIMNVVKHNRSAWNKESKEGGRWSIPVTSEEIVAARNGDWHVVLTPNKSVPTAWFDEIRDKKILCLASGGGQQVPILAAAGAKVTSFDNSDEQLAKDNLVAERDGLDLVTEQGDMADLSRFADNSFDLIFHPVSNVFVQDVNPVWKECHRVLRPGGRLLAGVLNPIIFLFDEHQAQKTGKLEVKYPLPYSDLTSISAEAREKLTHSGEAYAFGHTLEDQLGGQIKAGFVIAGFYEDHWDDEATLLNKYSPTYIATLAIKS